METYRPMNLAILIAVSNYLDAKNDLPACVNDFVLIDSILTTSGKYSEVLRLHCDPTSSEIKSKLANFITTHKNSDIEELFFYFTGHGDLYYDDFYFLLSDYDENKRQQTALSNEELDRMLRALSPDMTIKIVDACHSGVSYVKSAGLLKKSLDASKGKYEKCYFMFSSQKEQSSFQDAHYSDFTKSFGKSIQTRTQENIRYKDIADFISDEFENKGHQTPTFVLQADLTDIFCCISTEMRDDLNKLLTPSGGTGVSKKDDLTNTDITSQNLVHPHKLRELVIREAEQYCTENEALESINGVKSTLEKHNLVGDLQHLYDLELSIKSDFSGVPNMKSIASWLNENPNEYFVQINYREEEYEETIQVPKKFRGALGTHLRTVATLTGNDYETSVITKKRHIPINITLTVNPPFCAFEICLIPKYQNLPWWKEYVVLVFSKATLRAFYAIVRLKEKNWSERILLDDVKWKTEQVSLKEKQEVCTFAEKIVGDLESSVLKMLHDRYELPVSSNTNFSDSDIESTEDQ